MYGLQINLDTKGALAISGDGQLSYIQGISKVQLHELQRDQQVLLDRQEHQNMLD